ncbi:Uncharacterised protein [Yersinia mollaretii]|nr:Uncharacterised protein [Yersinia mollaretii]
MVKQRDIIQIQSRVGDIHRDITAHAIGAGQSRVAAVSHLQHATASDGIGKGAVKAAQRQSIQCTRQRNRGRRPQISG